MKVKSVLIDTTFLLPLFGISTKKFQREDLVKLLSSNIEIWFNPISLIEIKWVIYRISRRNPRNFDLFRKMYNETVDSLVSGADIKPTPLINSEIDKLESFLFERGVKDYFDRIIASTAKITTGILLTEDKELKLKLKEIEEFQDLKMLSWLELKKQI